MELHVVLSTKTFIYGKGKSFLGLAMFKSLKPTQTLIFFFSMLDNHCEYLAMYKKVSVPLLLNFCLDFDQDIWVVFF
jgi:hypothetical protein